MRPLDRDTANLLRAIVKSHGPQDAATIAGLATRVGRWDLVIDGARQHGILPMLYSTLSANKVAVPPEALEYARKEYERNTFHCMANAAELLEVLDAFRAAGINAMPFKGIVLGASAYGDMTARTAGDLDLLIYRRDLLRGAEILKSRGYELKTNVLADGSPASENYFEYHFERAADGMVLELRWRLELTQPRYRYDLGMDWVWPRRRTTKIAGADIPNLDAVSTLLVLCMHGSKHVWSRLVWVCDVARLLESEPGLDWRFAQKEAKRVGLWRVLALGVLLANRIAGAEVPPPVLRHFESNAAMRKVAQFLEERLAEEPGRIPDGRIPYNISILGFRDVINVVLSPAFLKPTSRDQGVIRLPGALKPLYYVIRPIRMLLDRTGR